MPAMSKVATIRSMTVLDLSVNVIDTSRACQALKSKAAALMAR